MNLSILLLTSTLIVAPLLPDNKLTPGAINPAITQANISTTICRKGGYTNGPGVRNVSESTKKAIFKEYNIDRHGSGSPYEADHEISLEIGGSNDIKNLWPQSYVTPTWNAHVKDALEDHLHALVCSGKIPLNEAQTAISTDWIAAYKKYMPVK